MTSSPNVLARFSGAIALIIGMLAMLFAIQPAAAQNGDSSIEVHSRICPEGYTGDNWFEDCHGNVPDPGLPYTFTNQDTGETYEGTTNAEGNVGFANLSAGTWTITGGAPGEFTDYAVYCSIGPEGDPNRGPVSVQYITGGVQFELPASTNVICDWYIVPLGQSGAPTATEPAAGDSSIEVHARGCPEGYDGTDYFSACHNNPVGSGLPFTFTNEDTGATYEGTTNANGNVGFANLNAGTFTITGGAPGEFTELAVFCSTGSETATDREQVTVQYVTGGVQFELPASTNVVCDWYIVPQGQQGQTPTASPEQFDLPIYTLLCDTAPGDGAASDFVMMGTVPEGCEQYAGATVTITSPEGETYGSCVTNAAEPCFVTVPIGGIVLATIDPATLPAGYTALGGQTQEVEIPPASEAWVLFIGVPAPTPTPLPPTPTPLPPMPTPVPVEGREVAIHEGACDTDPGAVVVDLTDLTAPELGPDTDANVIIAETSSTTVDIPLDELIENDNVVIAYSDDETAETETPVACTAIAGQMNANGELVLGLQEVDDSSFAGIIYLAPSDDGTGTDISVFLAEGLVEDPDAEATPTQTPVG